MDDLEFAEMKKMQQIRYRNEAKALVKSGKGELYHTSSDIAGVKIYNADMSVILNGNGSDGQQSVVIVSDEHDFFNMPLTILLSLQNDAYLSADDCSEEPIATLKAGGYYVFDGGGWVVIQKNY